MTREYNKTNRQHEIIQLCYGAGYTLDDLLEAELFSLEIINKEWNLYISEENWHRIVENNTRDEILFEIQKYIGIQISVALGCDKKEAISFHNMDKSEYCWSDITTYQAKKAGLVVSLAEILTALDDILKDVHMISNKVRRRTVGDN